MPDLIRRVVKTSAALAPRTRVSWHRASAMFIGVRNPDDGDQCPTVGCVSGATVPNVPIAKATTGGQHCP